MNSNPATIMTDKNIADEVYIEPLTVHSLEQIILKEKPDSILPTLGGQAGLNLAMEIAETGFLEEHNVKLIGTTAETIKKAEDRLEFKTTMEKSESLVRLLLLLRMLKTELLLPIRLVTLLFSALHIHSVEAAVVSLRMKKNLSTFFPMV